MGMSVLINAGNQGWWIRRQGTNRCGGKSRLLRSVSGCDDGHTCGQPAHGGKEAVFYVGLAHDAIGPYILHRAPLKEVFADEKAGF